MAKKRPHVGTKAGRQALFRNTVNNQSACARWAGQSITWSALPNNVYAQLD
jgi:hypothetical protein